MSKQFEKPGIDLLQFCKTLGVSPETAKLSGGQFVNFRAGWAKPVFSNAHKVHYFERSTTDISQAIALCGMTSDARWLYGPGNYEYCRNCKSRYRFRRAP